MSNTSTRALFPPWNLDSWKQVDDSIRGGASKSFLVAWSGGNNDGKYKDAVSFHGHLDISTLGGAGFASQKYEFKHPLNWGEIDKSKSHLTLLIIPPKASEKNVNRPSEFVVTLKTTRPPPPSQPKPRSQVTYESSFTAPTTQYSSPKSFEGISVTLPLASFLPTYRGRAIPPDDPRWQELDPTSIYEIGFMCRSEFGKQEGDFELVISAVEVHCVRTSAIWRWCVAAWRHVGHWFKLTRIPHHS
ncbi:hypothetical protein FRC14_005730 [Serendipita sp. 396]|nr:hypothetical protein FRC14_005730 [Serendipita sp. 396]KAG8787218.1 hypothetical protein FRC15_009715 [Serendipita sp. 397]KAG8835948.1 hypothetical protein FRC18_012111 [Serendipita sp. 400]KAG8856871.1 hypothetical protein FRB91_000209 [Serendipita sp. 411]